MTDDLKLDDGQLGRLERGVGKAERAEQGLLRAGANAARVGRELADKLKDAAENLAKLLSEAGLDEAANVAGAAAELADDGLAGARAVGALLPGVGAVAGGVAGTALGARRRELREQGIRESQLRANEQFEFEEGLRREREAAEAAKKARAAVDAGSLGGGSAAAAAAMRRARGSARR